MALFHAPGWDVPMSSLIDESASSKKRKRPAAHAVGGDGNGVSELQRAPSSEMNIDKMMKKMQLAASLSRGMSIDGAPSQKSQRPSKKRPKSRSAAIRKQAVDEDVSMDITEMDEEATELEEEAQPQRQEKKKRLKNEPTPTKTPTRPPLVPASSLDAASFVIPGVPVHEEDQESKKTKKTKKKNKQSDKEPLLTPVAHTQPNTSLTPMQQEMKQRLEGGRFRYINELLYKSDSKSAQKMLSDDPKVYEEYHVGFRQQVTSWPTNPVTHYINTLSKYPKGSLIVDLGCGDAALAKTLVPKGFHVMSFDLVSDSPFVVEADICGKLPLPGSESGEGKIVDVVVCSLSLMSLNWLQCIREARRVLKDSGELKIAEVTSRFTNVDAFTAMICSLGFELTKKDQPTTHFTLFEYKAATPPQVSKGKDWKSQLKKSEDLLKPCEYKRR